CHLAQNLVNIENSENNVPCHSQVIYFPSVIPFSSINWRQVPEQLNDNSFHVEPSSPSRPNPSLVFLIVKRKLARLLPFSGLSLSKELIPNWSIACGLLSFTLKLSSLNAQP